MKTYFEVATNLKWSVKEWLEGHGITNGYARFRSDDNPDKESDAFDNLERNLVHALGYNGPVTALDMEQFHIFLDIYCQGEHEAGRCHDCDECSIGNAAYRIQDTFRMDPTSISEEDKPEFFKRLIGTVESWLVNYGFTPRDFSNEDRDGAIICGKEYDALADVFAEVLGMKK